MDFWDLTKLLVRRWRVALPLLLLTIAAVAVVGQTIKPDYKATSYVSLVPPPEADDGAARTRNPWLNTGLNSLATAAIITVQGKSVADGLAAGGFSRSYTLTLAGPYEPIVTVEVVAPTQAGATATAREVARLLDQSVASIQADSGVAARDLITTLPIRGDNVEASSTKVVRAMIMVGALGLLLTAATTIGLDAFIRRRRRSGSAVAIRTRARDAAASGWGQRAANPVPPVLPATSPLLSATHPGRPALAGGGVTRHGVVREQETHRVEPDPSAHAASVDYRASDYRASASYAAGEEEDGGLGPTFVDPRSAPPSEPIDSTIVLPLTAPGPWSTGDRGKRR